MNELIPARADEIDEIDSFLAPLTTTSMFLRSNIRDHGVTGGADRYATNLWLKREGPKLVGVVGLTTGGIVLLQMPRPELSEMRRAATTLAGMAVTGISGEARQRLRQRRSPDLAGDIQRADLLLEQRQVVDASSSSRPGVGGDATPEPAREAPASREAKRNRRLIRSRPEFSVGREG